jgi:uncharacterized protein involved in exopolysaccharide biosynthesis
MTPTQNQNQVRLLELADMILRWWWIVVAGVCVGAAVSELALQSIRPIYESVAVVNADAEKLPRDMVRSTVPDAPPELQLGVVRNAVLRDENIEKIVQEEFPDSSEPKAVLIDRVIANVRLTSSSDPRKPLVTIRYQDADPKRAARVAQRVAELTVAENAEIRARTAATVTDTIESLSVRVEKDLAEVNRKIRDLYASHPNQTNAQIAVNTDGLTKARTNLAAVTEALDRAKERKASYEAERARAGVAQGRGGTTVGASSSTNPEIAKLELEIADLRLKNAYSDKHPEIRRRLQQIENLRRATQNAPPTSQPSAAPSATPPPFDYLQTNIRAASLEVDRLTAEQSRLAGERERYQRYLDETPRVEVELGSLVVERDRLERELNAKSLRIDTARTGQQIEEKEIGNPFEILYEAVVPSSPIWPNRLQFLGFGIVGGLALFLGPLVAWRLLRPVIASEAGLRALGDVPVLISIPVIPTPALARRERRIRIRNLGIVVASVIVLLAAHAVRILR